MKKNNEKRTIIFLCGDGGGIPTIDFTNPEKVVLKDGFGGKVELTQRQWSHMESHFVSKKG